MSNVFITREQIDAYARYLENFAHRLIDETISWTKNDFRDRICSWWTREIVTLVKEKRSLRRERDTWVKIETVTKRKKKIIWNEKRRQFKQSMQKLHKKSSNLWWMTKWIQLRNHKASKIFLVSALQQLQQSNEDKTDDFAFKTNILINKFFSQESTANLSDINNLKYFAEVTPLFVFTEDEIRRFLIFTHSRKVSELNEISNSFLKIMNESLVQAIRALTKTCWNWQYYSKTFKCAKTIALRKSSRNDYTVTEAWRLIVLLNTIEKIVKRVTARRLQSITEKHSLLLKLQIKARQKRSTESALDPLLSQIRTIWEKTEENHEIVSILSLNMTKVFDNVITTRLTHILWRKEISDSLMSWVLNFMTNRTAYLTFDDQKSRIYHILVDISQRSCISSIFFLFYNSKLIEICNLSDKSVMNLKFVNDVNILVYSVFTKNNCRILRKVHDRCFAWAARHEARFVSEKYELMHLTRCWTQFNIKYSLTLEEIVIESTNALRILRLHLDSDLRWHAHLIALQRKLTTQMNAVMRLTEST